MPAEQAPHDLSIAEAARRKNVSGKTIRRWIAEGRLPAERVGPRLIRIRPEDLDAVGHRIPSAASA